jgi:hypothetical protein
VCVFVTVFYSSLFLRFVFLAMHQDNGCPNLSRDVILNVNASSLEACKRDLGVITHASIFDFRQACTHHATSTPNPEEEDAPVRLYSEDDATTTTTTKHQRKSAGVSTVAALLWDRRKKERASSAATKKGDADNRIGRNSSSSSSSSINRQLLSTASASDLQPTPRDIVHTLWLNGPTYSTKIYNNRIGGGRWPVVDENPARLEAYSPLFLRGANGHCLKTGLVLGLCWTYIDGLGLNFEAATSSLVDYTGAVVCAAGNPETPSEGAVLELSSSTCKSPAMVHDESTGVIRHSSTGLCVMPADVASSFADADTNSLQLGSDCSSWRFGAFTAWNRPPGYEEGFPVQSNVGGGSLDPPRYSINLGANTCEPMKTRLADASGGFATNLTLRRVSDGETYPHNIAYVDHIAWPSGTNCKFFFRPYELAADGVYPNWMDDFAAFFPIGSSFTVEKRNAEDADELCDASRSRYSGYESSGGGYCYTSSNSLDDEPHLLIHSGWVGLVLDASMNNGNLVPKFGSIALPIDDSSSSSSSSSSGADDDDVAAAAAAAAAAAHTSYNLTSQEIYALLPDSELVITLTLDSTGEAYTLSRSSAAAATISPVRQGPVVSHILTTMLRWVPSSSSSSSSSTSVDLVAPQWWLEFDVWTNAISINLGWDELAVGSGCAICEAATVELNLTIGDYGDVGGGSVTHTRTAQFTPGSQFAPTGISFTFENLGAAKSTDTLTSSGDYQSPLSSLVSVSSSTSGANVVDRRDGSRMDVVLEVPTSMQRCSYSSECSPLLRTSITVANSDAVNEGLVRLTVSRNFPTRTNVAQSRVSAEITGLSALVRDANGHPIGLPMQISKKWDEVTYKQVYEARYEVLTGGGNNWWTINMVLRLPPSTTTTLDFAIVYNKYGGVPSFSAAQLSLIGYTDSWVWHETSLGSLGENICFDVIGAHARGQITDVRVELFTGVWYENTGGGDFLVYYNGLGSYVYSKATDANILSPGPCLSNASFTQTSADGAISMQLSISGSRTDDFTKHFFHFRYEVLQDMNFSRLAFFQHASDYYDPYNTFTYFKYGSAADGSWPNYDTTASSCHDQLAYPSSLPYRQEFEGDAPWWVSMGPQTQDSVVGLGDRGLVLREYDAQFNGEHSPQPAFSFFCDKVELSVPEVVGNDLKAGDFVEFK